MSEVTLPKGRRVVEARATLLAEIDRLIASGFRTPSRAINELRARIMNGAVADEIDAAAKNASERPGIPSRTSFYTWLSRRDAMGLLGLVPRSKNPHAPSVPGPPLDNAARQRVGRCSRLLAGLAPAERERVFNLNRPAVEDYARLQGWSLA